MSYVEVRTNPNKSQADLVVDALKELKRRMKKEGILQDLKKYEFYMSPSKKKRFREKEAFKRRKRDERKKEWYSKKPDLSEFE